ncbi:RNA polymerase sigma factor [Sphingomonas hengshuiensis]|uniref:RNA polymerase sigma factor n=1 Tax=Sphingomonas hengshuiensis TaxID=1609977 RepID=UPI0005C9DB3A|nr:RNA polymerase sigma factor [Sphingomonas hengshuiensis]
MDSTFLLHRFLQLYPDFRERLRRRLGSSDLADEALNEVYLKLRHTDKTYSVRNIGAYLFRLTLNTASDQRRAAARLAGADEIEAAMELADPAPDPLRTIDSKDMLAMLAEAVETLSERRRSILIAVRLEGRSCREIAQEMGLNKRTVELELRHALDHCAERLAKSHRSNFANDPARTSYH